MAADRLQLERLQATQQEKQTAWLEAQDALMDARDAMMEAQLAADIEAAQQRQNEKQNAREDRQPTTSDTQINPDDADADGNAIQHLQQQVALAEQAEQLAAADLAAVRLPLENHQAAMAPLLAEEEKLLILIEIEKLALPQQRLEFDRQRQQLLLTDAQRQLQDGRVAFDAGAISALRLQELEDAVAQEQGQMDVLLARLEIAQAGIPAEDIAAAQAEVDRAAVNAERALANGQARLAKIDADIAVLDVEVANIVHEMRQLRQRYPRLLDAEEQRLRQQRQRAAGQPMELAAIDEELQKINQERAALPDDPAAIQAPIAGVARLGNKKVGSGVSIGDAVVRIFPPTGLQVQLAVDEATLLTLQREQAVTIRIPAISEETVFAGTVDKIGGLGYDKSQDVPERSEPTGIVLFPVG